DRGETKPLWLILGVRRQDDLLYREELEALVKAHPNVRVEFTLSRPDEHWTGRTGYVQTHVKELWAALEKAGGDKAEVGTPHAYICGLQRMVGAVRDLLRKDMALPRQHVHSERYD